MLILYFVVVCRSCCSAWHCTDCDGRRHWCRHVVQDIWSSGELHRSQNSYLIIVQQADDSLYVSVKSYEVCDISCVVEVR